MLGKVTVPVLPYRRRDDMFGPMRNAVVTVYNAQGDGSAAVSDYGVVAPTATAAYVYQDRAGANLMPNPATLDNLGGPIDIVAPGGDGIYFSFYGFPGIYHLLVVMPTGQRFGIPFVRVVHDPQTWVEVNVSALYNDTIAGLAAAATFLSGGSINNQWGTDMAADSTCPGRFGALSVLGAAQTALWIGEQEWTSGSSPDPFMANNLETTNSIYGRPLIIEAVLHTDQVFSPSATMFSGISMGRCVTTVTANPIPASPTQPLIALYIECATPTFNLLIAKGDSTAYEKLILTGVGTPNLPSEGIGGKPDRLQIRYNPSGPAVEGWVNGWFGGRITTASKFPGSATAKKAGFHHFASTGSIATGNIGTLCNYCRYYVGIG